MFLLEFEYVFHQPAAQVRHQLVHLLLHLQQEPQAITDDSVVVGQEDGDSHCATSTTTRAPH